MSWKVILRKNYVFLYFQIVQIGPKFMLISGLFVSSICTVLFGWVILVFKKSVLNLWHSFWYQIIFELLKMSLLSCFIPVLSLQACCLAEVFIELSVAKEKRVSRIYATNSHSVQHIWFVDYLQQMQVFLLYPFIYSVVHLFLFLFSSLLDRCPGMIDFIVLCFIVRSIDAVGFSAAMTSSFAIIAKVFPNNIATVVVSVIS